MMPWSGVKGASNQSFIKSEIKRGRRIPFSEGELGKELKYYVPVVFTRL